MKPEIIIVRYAEIGLKAKKTRKYFESILIKNIKNALKTKKIQHQIIKEWGRIYVKSPQILECISVLKKITGIVSVSPVFKTESKPNSILKQSLEVSKILTNKKSFALRVKRTGDHDFTSQEIAIKIGEKIVQKTKVKVDLTNPDIEIFIEIRQNNSYIFTEKICGIGGLPYGTQGDVLVIIEDFYSILAAWYLMKRGCKINFLTNNKKFINDLESFTKNWYIPLNKSETNSSFYTNFDAIVTGYLFEDEIDETLSKIKDLKQKYKLPVLTPLISFQKQHINQKIREIGLSV